MDINIAFLNSQLNNSIDFSQVIESEQDFSIIMDKQVVVSKSQGAFSEKVISDSISEENWLLNENNENPEKNILSPGNEFPLNINELSEKNDDPAPIYGVMFNPLIYQSDNESSSTEYLETVNIIQLATENEFQSKDEKNINDLSQDKILKKEVPEIVVQTSLPKIENNLKPIYENKTIKTNADFLYDKDNEDSVLTSLIPSDFSLDGKSKNKITSQLSVYESTLEFNENNMIESDLVEANSKENIESSEINYDPNQTQAFEKELGEHLVSMVKQNDHQVKLKINPPELGNIDIDLNLNDEQADVSFYTGNLQVMATIEASISELKSLFNNQNLSLGDVHVFHQSSDENKKHHQDFYETQKNENIEQNSIKKSTKEKLNKPSSGNISVFV